MAAKKPKKPTYEMYKIAFQALTNKVKMTLDEPDSEKGRNIAKLLEEATGIERLKIQRFHNALLRGTARSHFMEEEIESLSWALFRVAMAEDKTPLKKLRGHLSKFANDYNFSFNTTLETFRRAFHENIDEHLSDQKIS